MRNLLLLLTSFFFGIFAHAGTPVAHEYVSIDCPKGDMTLLLNQDGKFSLELKHWDSTQNKHTRTENLSGNWSIADKKLTLLGNVNIEYVREPSSMKIGKNAVAIDGFNWLRSSKPSFADTFTLVERKAVDEFLKGAIPK
jgi:hypothetical protein